MSFVLNNDGLSGLLKKTNSVEIIDQPLIKLDAENIQVSLKDDQQFDASCDLIVMLPDMDFGGGQNSIVLNVSLFDAIESETTLELNQTINPFPIVSLILEEVSFGFRSNFKGGGDWWVKPKASAQLSFKDYFDLPIENVGLQKSGDKWIFSANIQLDETVSCSTPAIQIELNLGSLQFLQRNNRQALQLTADGSIVLPALGLQLTGTGIKVGTTLDKPLESWLECESVGVNLSLPPNSDDPTFIFSGTIRDFGEKLDIAGNLSIPPLGLEGGGSLIVDEPNNAYYISARLKFVTPQPIGSSGLGVFELQALSGYNVGLDKGENESWYKFLTKSPRGLNAGDNSKFAVKEGSVLAGFGGTIGSLDGFLVNGIVIGVIEFPDFLLIEGRMNVFEAPVPYDTTNDPHLQVWMVLEKSSVTVGAAIDYRLPDASGSFLKLSARLDAFYDLNNSRNWYLRIGNPTRPAAAEVAGFIRGKGFIEVTPQGIRGMCSQEVKLKLGPLQGRSAWQVSGKMNYDPFYVAANGSLVIGGRMDLGRVRIYAYGRARAEFIYGVLQGRGGRDFLYFRASVRVSAGVTIRISRFFKIRLSASVTVRISHGHDQTNKIKVEKLDALSGQPSLTEAQDAFVFQRKNTFQAISQKVHNTIPPDSIISAHFKRPVKSSATGVVRSDANVDPLAQGKWGKDFNLTQIELQILLDDSDVEVWEDFVVVFSQSKKVIDPSSLKYFACWDKSVDKSTRQLHVLDTKPRNATHNRTHTLEMCNQKSQYKFFLHEWNSGEMLMANTWYRNDSDTLALKIRDFNYSGSGKLLHSPLQDSYPDEIKLQIEFLVPEAEQMTGRLKLYRLCSDDDGSQIINPDPFLEIFLNNPLIQIKDTPSGLHVVCDLDLSMIDNIEELLQECKLLIRIELEVIYHQDQFDPKEYLESLNAHDIVLRPDSQYRFRLIRNQGGNSSDGGSNAETLRFKTGALMSGYQPVTTLGSTVNLDLPKLEERLIRPRCNFDTGQFIKPQYKDDCKVLLLSLQGLWFFELLSTWVRYPNSHLLELNPNLILSVSGLSANGVVATEELPVAVRRSDKSGSWEFTSVNRRQGSGSCDLYTFHTKQKDETLLEIDLSQLAEPLRSNNAYNLSLEIDGEKYLDLNLIQSAYENHGQLCELLKGNVRRVNANANLEPCLWDLRMAQRSGETGVLVLSFSETPRALSEQEHETLKQLLHIDVDRNSAGEELCIFFSVEPLLRSDVPDDHLIDCFVSADRTMIVKMLQGDEHQVSVDIRSPMMPNMNNPVTITL